MGEDLESFKKELIALKEENTRLRERLDDIEKLIDSKS
jgi:hypothetical protein